MYHSSHSVSPEEDSKFVKPSALPLPTEEDQSEGTEVPVDLIQPSSSSSESTAIIGEGCGCRALVLEVSPKKLIEDHLYKWMVQVGI